MDALLTTIVLWLSLNFNLPATYEHPRVEFVKQERIASLVYSGFVKAEGVWSASPADPKTWSVLAAYDSPHRTIYLREGWTGTSPAESSILVHEMVHHLQTVSGQRYNCAQEREALAYQAQDKWLKTMGRSLETEFETDGLTLLVLTQCLD